MELIKDTSVEQDDVLVGGVDVLFVTVHQIGNQLVRTEQLSEQRVRIGRVDHDVDIAVHLPPDLNHSSVGQTVVGERLRGFQGLSCKNRIEILMRHASILFPKFSLEKREKERLFSLALLRALFSLSSLSIIFPLAAKGKGRGAE